MLIYGRSARAGVMADMYKVTGNVPSESFEENVERKWGDMRKMNGLRYGSGAFRIARGFSSSGSEPKDLTQEEKANMTEDERLLYNYAKVKAEDKNTKLQPTRMFNEKFAFNEDQRLRIRKVASNKLNIYLERYKFLTVLDEQLLNETLIALLTLNSYKEIDPNDQVPTMIQAMIEKVFTLRNPEVIFNLFQVTIEQDIPITEENLYLLNAILISWGPKLEYRQQLSVLNTVPADQFDKYKDIFHSYEDLFIEFFAQGFESKSHAEKYYVIEMLKVFRKVNYDSMGFVENIEELLFENLPSLSTFTLTKLIVYIVQTEDMGMDRREGFLQKLDNEVIARARFFNEVEAVDVLFYMMRSAIGSHLARRLLIAKATENVRLLPREKMLVLITVLGTIQDRYKEKLAAIQIIKDYVHLNLLRLAIL
jgi:hypothetical protein